MAYHWQFRRLTHDYSVTIPILTSVVAYRDMGALVDYGNGAKGPERRIIVSLDRFDGLEWLHEGTGRYVGYYPVFSVLQWDNGPISTDRRYLARVGISNTANLVPYEPIPKGIYLAKVLSQPTGLVWQCYQPGHRFRSSEDFIQKPRFISVPSINITHWQELPMVGGQWFA